MSCNCLTALNLELKSNTPPLEIETVFDMKMNVWPEIKATNYETREKGKKLVSRTIIPSYCFICGKKYKLKE